MFCVVSLLGTLAENISTCKQKVEKDLAECKLSSLQNILH